MSCSGGIAGKAEGRKDERLKVAKVMKQERIPVETIAKCTGLSVQEIKALK